MPFSPDELMAWKGYAESIRTPYENDWQDIFDMGHPLRGDITTIRGEGNRRVPNVLDTTFMQSSDAYARFMKSTVIPSGTRWIRVLPPDGFEENFRAKELTHSIGNKILRVAATSNFYVQNGAALRDYSLTGNCTIYGEERTPRLNEDGSTFGGMSFEAVFISNVWIVRGKADEVEMVIRRYDIPARRAFSHFAPDHPGSFAQEKMDQGKSMELVCYFNFVYPNDEFAPGQGGLNRNDNKRFTSDWIQVQENGDMQFVKRSGRDTWPYVNGRYFQITGETYGRGLGNIARVDAAGMSELRRQIYMAIGKELNPPIITEDETTTDIDLTPGQVNFVDPPLRMEPQFLRSGADFAAADLVMRNDADKVERLYKRRAIEGRETQTRSATAEVAERDRAIQEISADAESIENQILTPQVVMMLEAMENGGALPELEELRQLTGTNTFPVEYVSPFFTAQKEDTSLRARGLVAHLIEVAAAAAQAGAPNAAEMLDIINFTDYGLTQAALADADTGFINSQEQVEQIRQARQLQEQAAAQREAIGDLATAAGRAAPAIAARSENLV